MKRPPDQITLWVFPFEDLSQHDDLAVFCRSFSDDLITELSRFSHFCVIRFPSSSFLPEFNDHGNSDYFIRGSFRSDRNIVRINVQLYNAITHQLSWGNRLEGKLTELADIQERLLTEVTGVLQQQIKHDLLSKIKKREKVEFRAYEHWLYGIEEIKKGSVENDATAREHFQKALEIAPNYSLAYSGMSLSYFNEWSCQLWDKWDAAKYSACEWAQKAIELDDQNYIAAMVLGKIMLYDEAYETSQYYLRKSLQLNPNDPETVIQIAAYFMLLGLNEEAVELYERTLLLDPLNRDAYAGIGAFVLFEAGDFNKAAELSRHVHNNKWADAEAYYAGVFYYLQDYDKMNFHWNKFLENYRRLISKGKDFTQQEACEWVLEINPHKKKSNLEGFLQFISKGTIEKQKLSNAGEAKEKENENYFLKETAVWKISFDDEAVQIPEVKGFYDIQKLLGNPNQFFHCAELMGTTVSEKGEKLFDAKARQEYEKKILSLQNDMQEAENNCQFERLEKLQNEYDQLLQYLSESLGLNRKVRQTGSTVEKARSAITWRIRNAIAKIEPHLPVLGAYLSNTIKTGTLCCYQPDRNMNWKTG